MIYASCNCNYIGNAFLAYIKEKQYLCGELFVFHKDKKTASAVIAWAVFILFEK